MLYTLEEELACGESEEDERRGVAQDLWYTDKMAQANQWLDKYPAITLEST